MQRILFLLILMGNCCFARQLYEYHYINETTNWTTAQNYCREHHTDLATVTNMADMKRLCDAANKHEAWIGLYNRTDINRTWHWSLPGVEFNYSEIKWGEGEPNDKGGHENCGFIRKNLTTNNLTVGDVSCEDIGGFFLCYNETDKNIHLISKHKKWLEAQKYCRYNHTDLASGPDLVNYSLPAIADPEKFILIGLFRDTWLWSDNSSFSFRNWHLDFMSDPKKSQCAVLNANSEWKSADCTESKRFICYKDKVILVKLNYTWEEALEYCTEKHHELVSITDLNEQRWIQDRAKQADTDFVWTGLRYTCTLEFWFWITDEVVSYENWAPGEPRNECDMSGAMGTRGNHTWISKPDVEKFNFICYKE